MQLVSKKRQLVLQGGGRWQRDFTYPPPSPLSPSSLLPLPVFTLPLLVLSPFPPSPNSTLTFDSIVWCYPYCCAAAVVVAAVVAATSSLTLATRTCYSLVADCPYHPFVVTALL